jgi:retinol dehydrogenase 12
MQVVIITGGYSGIGYQLTKLVYDKNAIVYIAGRRESEGLRAIEEIQTSHPNSKGRLEFLFLDLADLATVKKCAEEFLKKEKRLDVLWNNAGLMGTSKDDKSKQVCDPLAILLSPAAFLMITFC